MTTATVAYFIKGRGKKKKVLLGKKTKKVCRNKQIGPGGKRENETYANCMVREVEEEVHVNVETRDLLKVATIDFIEAETKNGPGKITRVVFYLIRRWQGRFKSNGDLHGLRWFKIDNVPLKRMMLGHPVWFQLAISEQYYVRGSIYYSKGRKRVKSFVLKVRKLA